MHTHTYTYSTVESLKCSAVYTGAGGIIWRKERGGIICRKDGKGWNRQKKFQKNCNSLERLLLGGHPLLIKALLTCQHPPNIKPDKWTGIYMWTAWTLGGISWESNLTQTLSWHEKMPQQLGHTHAHTYLWEDSLVHCNISGISSLQIYYQGLGCSDRKYTHTCSSSTGFTHPQTYILSWILL